jgi:hypothetical protein
MPLLRGLRDFQRRSRMLKPSPRDASKSVYFWEVATMHQDDRLTYAARRAYHLARSGSYQDFVSIQEAIVDEGFAETVPWLERPGVMEALAEICVLSCRAKTEV